MNKISIKHLALFVMLLLSSVCTFATNDGTTIATAYLVCGKTSFKLTSTVAVPTGGNIQWFQGNGTAISGGTSVNQTFPALNTVSTNGVIDTTFKIVVYNAAGCPSDSGIVHVKIVPPPTVLASVDNSAICSASAAATTLHLSTSTTGTPTLPSGVAYTYNWTGGTGTGTINTPTSATATSTPPTTAGTYTYTVAVNYSGLDVNTSTSNASGCSVSSGANVTISTTPAKPASTITAN
jgi:hypothetical protein